MPESQDEILRVAIDARFAVLDDRGIGRYTRAVAARLRARAGVRCTFVVPLGKRRRVAARLGCAREEIALRVPAGTDVIWNPSNATDLRGAAPSVTMIHDLVPFSFPAPKRSVREAEQGPLLQTAQRARRIVVNSYATAQDVVEWLHVDAGMVVVTPLGVEPAFRTGGARFTLPGGRPYLLHVGAHDPRKNSATLIDAWQRGVAGLPALVFTRRPPSPPSGAVVIDAPTDDALAALYRGATIVAVPSLDEGFGLPLLEACACGTPVLASRRGALPEVGGDAVHYVDDVIRPDAWHAALVALAGDPAARAALSVAGPLRAAPFTWERCADRTLEVLRAAARVR